MSSPLAAPLAAPLRMSGQDWLLLVALSVLWGGTFFFAKIALADIPPMTLVFGRVSIAAVTLFIVLKASGLALPSFGRLWAAFFVLGLINNVLPFNLIFWGQHQMPAEIAASLASILNATTPVFAVVIAHFLTLDEKLTPRRALGVVFGFMGVFLLLAPRLLSAGARADVPAALGMLACLSASCVYVFGGLYARRFKAMGVAPMQLAFGQLAASSLIMLPVASFADRPWTLPMPGLAPLAALAGLAVISTALAFVLFFRILASAGTTNLLLVTFLIPVTAILLGVAFLGEHLGFIHLAAMALIGLGLAAIDGRVFTLLRRAAPQAP